MSKKNKRTPKRQAEIALYKKNKKLRKQIRTGDDPALHVKCDIIDPRSHQALAVAFKLAEVAQAFENGVGLAAPQIGETVRIIYAWPNRLRDKDSKGVVMINPEIVDRSTAIDIKVEGCLSYPGKSAAVDRAREVTVRWFDVNGEIQQEKFEGWPARVVQHELDHLDGVCRVGDASPDEPVVLTAQPREPRYSPKVAAAVMAGLAMFGAGPSLA